MKRLLSILLLLLLPLFCMGAKATNPHSTEEKGATACMLKASTGNNIEELAGKLQECRFDQPQTGGASITRHGGDNNHRRTCKNSKDQESRIQSSTVKTTFSSDDTCQKAVVSSRHDRGYYIYALRHIII